MRSQAVFHASEAMGNRFQLCGVCASGTRKLHVDSGRIQDTINTVLVLMSKPRNKGHPDSQSLPILLEESDGIYDIVIDSHDFAARDSTQSQKRADLSSGKSGGRLSFMQLNQSIE
jgi:hypothetical protein